MADNTKTQIEEMEILDPTPREVTIGDRKFLIKPLVMKHYKKLFAIVGGAMSGLVQQIQAGQSEALVAALTEIQNNPFAITKYIDTIFFTASDKILDFLGSVLGVEPEWLDDNMTMDQLALVLFVVYQQNEVDKIIENFSRIGKLAQARGHLPNAAALKQLAGAVSTQS